MTQDEFDEIGWKKGQDIVVDGHSGLTSYLALAVDFRDRMVLAEIGAGVSWVPCADILSPLWIGRSLKVRSPTGGAW